MNNYYQTVQDRPEIFHQFAYKQLLFIYYDCPLAVSKIDTWSEHNYFLYVVTGKKGLHSSSRSWILQQGDAVFVKKGACVLERFSEELLCLMAFFAPDSYLKDFLKEHSELIRTGESCPPSGELVIELEVNHVMSAYYNSILPYFTSGARPPESLLELKFRELLLNIVTNPANKEFNAYLQTLISTPTDNLQHVVESNCYFNLPLEAYAKLCNRSLSSFKRDFVKVYQAAPATWLQEKKLARAKHLLLSTDKPVRDLSFDSGFENSTHFSRVFKQRYGYPPLQFRKRQTGSVVSGAL